MVSEKIGDVARNLSGFMLSLPLTTTTSATTIITTTSVVKDVICFEVMHLTPHMPRTSGTPQARLNTLKDSNSALCSSSALMGCIASSMFKTITFSLCCLTP